MKKLKNMQYEIKIMDSNNVKGIFFLYLVSELGGGTNVSHFTPSPPIPSFIVSYIPESYQEPTKS